MTDSRLQEAEVLVELGWLYDAELLVARILDAFPGNLNALSLFAKIKHIRGELSQAIACWAHIHAQTSHPQAVLIQLEALMNLATDPERAVSDFVAVGKLQLARKPVGQLAIEEAFGLFRAHRLDEARTRCIELAAQNRDRDDELFKLATLALAWIAELSGELDRAIEILERMGRMRGFETDSDRLYALARVYEREGSPAHLQAAAKVLSHLEHELKPAPVADISLYRRLAAVHLRLGNDEVSAAYRRRYAVAYRAHAHRPSYVALLEVAARQFIRLEELDDIGAMDRSVPEDASSRVRAIAAALKGSRDEARRLWEQQGATVDRKYLANLAALEGDPNRAVAVYLACLEEDPCDLQVIGWLLEHSTRASSEMAFGAIRSYFRRTKNMTAARTLLHEAIRQAPLRPSLWRQVAALHTLAGDPAESARCREHAQTLAAAALERSQPIGRALSAGVYHFIGRTKGLIHEIWAHRQPVEPGKGGNLPADAIFGNVTDELKSGIQNAFIAVREYARAKFPSLTSDLFDYTYTFKVPKEDEPSGGLSAGLPTALAFLSVFLQRPVRQDIASTGVLVAEAHDVVTVAPVLDVEHKVNAAFHRNLRGLLLPRANASDVEGSDFVPVDVCRDLIHYVWNLDEAAKLVLGEDIFLAPNK